MWISKQELAKSREQKKITTNLCKIAISLDIVVEHRAFHQERIISFQNTLDSFLVSRHKNWRLFILESQKKRRKEEKSHAENKKLSKNKLSLALTSIVRHIFL